MAHLLPHWTHPGKEGIEIPVVAYTNGKTAELFLNGESLGEKKVDPRKETVWLVPYAPGELKLLARDCGSAVTEQSVRTAGVARELSLKSNRHALLANRTDVARIEIDICDEAGVCVPLADHRMEIAVKGPGRLIGVENGDILEFGGEFAFHSNVRYKNGMDNEISFRSIGLVVLIRV